MNIRLILVILFVTNFTLTFGQQKNLVEYLSNIPRAPVKFEPGNISTYEVEYNSSLTYANGSFYFSTATSDFSTRSIMVSEFHNGHFEKPKRVSIGGRLYDASDVQVTNDGQTLYFKMRGNLPSDNTRRDGNIWKSEFENGKWGEAELLPKEVNSQLSEYYPIVTNSGNLYFSREFEEKSYDIFVSKFVDGKYNEALPLGGNINTKLLESDAYISPDESFMIFVRMSSDDGLGVSDLYITFNEEGEWTKPRNMKSLNSSGVDGSPFVTPDGKYLFFTSTRDSENPENFDGHLDIYVTQFDVSDWR